ncbi:uncharacterized protein TNCV_155091 [Trichonephila clavipes]|uniref:Transposase n=1 Tax=Trichonephila clavipes TaxID=2585209 RepID=A0A8X7BK66_TRICX|nr:uncharacterized protein TNCV_155091 [Trichonephila clavipes]
MNSIQGGVFRQDNARLHTAAVTKRALQSVDMVPWPARSPNLSPIEHVWDIIGRQLQHHPQPALIFPVLTQQLQQAWNSILQSDIRHLFATTEVIKSQLQDINVNASERTVRRKLKDLNFKTCRPTRKSKLTPATKAKRLNWAKHWRDKDVYFWRSNKTQFVRRRDGEKLHSDCVVRTVKHPTKIMIWSVISSKGTGRLDVVKARSIKAFLAEQNIPLLDWPGNSPDMNPIENIWELMKREVAKDVITNKTQLLE